MKRAGNFGALWRLVTVIVIMGMCFIFWKIHMDVSLFDSVLATILPTLITNTILPPETNLIVILKSIWSVRQIGGRGVDWGSFVKRKTMDLFVSWGMVLLVLFILYAGENLLARDTFSGTLVTNVPVSVLSHSENTSEQCENTKTVTKSMPSVDEPNIEDRKSVVQEETKQQNTVNDGQNAVDIILEDSPVAKDKKEPGSLVNKEVQASKNEITSSDEVLEDAIADIMAEIKKLPSEILSEKKEEENSPLSGIADDKKNMEAADSAGSHVDSKGDLETTDVEKDEDTKPVESGTAADGNPGSLGVITDKNPGAVADMVPEGPGAIVEEIPGGAVDVEVEDPGAITDKLPGSVMDIVPEKPGVDLDPPGAAADDVVQEEPDTDEEAQPPESDDIEKLPLQRNDYIVSSIEKKEGEAVSSLEKELKVTEEADDIITFISGETQIFDKIYYSGQERRYYFQPTISGIYFFKILSMKDCAEYRMEFGMADNKEVSDYSHIFEEVYAEDVIPIEINEGENYLIKVKQPLGFGEYILCIQYPQEERDISDFNNYQNRLEYPEEKHLYRMTPRHTGCYRFDMSGIAEDEDIKISVYSEDEAEKVYTGNKDGLTIEDMQADVTYKIVISEYSGDRSCLYDLQIGWQKETTNLNGYTGAKDSIQFQDQQNRYELIAETPGIFQSQVLDMEDGLEADMLVFDEDGKEIGLYHCTKDGINKLYKEVKEGEHITILIQGQKGIGGYMFDYVICPKDELVRE